MREVDLKICEVKGYRNCQNPENYCPFVYVYNLCGKNNEEACCQLPRKL